MNHYVDIEITGYRALHSKIIAGRGIARLIKVSWVQQGQLTALIEYLTVILEYIDLLVEYSQLLVGPSLGYVPEARYSINQDLRSLLA